MKRKLVQLDIAEPRACDMKKELEPCHFIPNHPFRANRGAVPTRDHFVTRVRGQMMVPFVKPPGVWNENSWRRRGCQIVATHWWVLIEVSDKNLPHPLPFLMDFLGVENHIITEDDKNHRVKILCYFRGPLFFSGCFLLDFCTTQYPHVFK